MPYNTRRKSLSLSELGITLPKRSRAISHSHPSPPSTIVEGEEPPVKKTKRSHGSASPPTGLMSPPRTTTIRVKDEKPKRAVELSPPPSPTVEGSNKVDVEGISDDIVVGTIQQLERTGNRPHLVKELGAVLATSLHSVERSANPSALISSRLTTYLNRSWPAISPCPLAKDLSPVHPRRLYFYLTTMPHQPIPETVEPLPKSSRIISPSLSSASVADEEERHRRQRMTLSPSPEVDLSSPELEDESQPPVHTSTGPFPARNSLPRDSSSISSHPPSRRGASPQLEREERDFKQTANALYEQAQLRRNSQQQDQADTSMDQADATAGASRDCSVVSMSIEGDSSDTSGVLKFTDDAAALFGHADHLAIPPVPHILPFSSPLIHPDHDDELRLVTSSSMKGMLPSHGLTSQLLPFDLSTSTDLDVPLFQDAFAWDSLRSPENVDIAELDDMFDAY